MRESELHYWYNSKFHLCHLCTVLSSLDFILKLFMFGLHKSESKSLKDIIKRKHLLPIFSRKSPELDLLCSNWIICLLLNKSVWLWERNKPDVLKLGEMCVPFHMKWEVESNDFLWENHWTVPILKVKRSGCCTENQPNKKQFMAYNEIIDIF